MPNDRAVNRMSDLPDISADLIAGRRFGQAWRGYDPEEVKQFLEQVAAQVRRLRERYDQAESARREAEQRALHPKFDEATLMSAVGEETAAILRSARSAAAEITAKADNAASQVVEEARARADAMVAEASALLAQRSAEAQEAASLIRERAEADASAALQAAGEQRAKLEAEAHERYDDTVAAAQALREKILTDLARRRKLATVQIEQLRAGRERLLDAYLVVRRTLDEVTDELQRADAEARAASDAVGRQHGTGPAELLDLRGDDPWGHGEADAARSAAPVPDSPRDAATGPAGANSEPATGTTGGPPAASSPRPAGTGLPASAPQGQDEPSKVPANTGPVVLAPKVTEVATATAPVAGLRAASSPPTGAAAAVGTSGTGAPLGTSSAVTPPAAVITLPSTSGRANGATPGRVPPEGEDSRARGKRQATGATSAMGSMSSAITPGDAVESVRLVRSQPADNVPPATTAPAATAGASPGAAGAATVPHAPATEPPPGVAGDATAPTDGPAEQHAVQAARSTVAGGDVTTAGAENQRDVETLFARIRAGREEAASSARRSLSSQSGNPSPIADQGADEADTSKEPGPATLDGARAEYFSRRDQLATRLEGSLARKLKRALQDEQNSLLDRLRSTRGTATAASVLPPAEEQPDRFVEAGKLLLEEAARAGSQLVAELFGGKGRFEAVSPDVVEDLADELGRSITDPLRQRLEAAFDAQAGDSADLAGALGAGYREWKTQRIEAVARDHVAAALSRGAYLALPENASLVWVVSESEGPCPDCDDNALAGRQRKGEAWPTGQLYPPAHPGCRCALAPEDQGPGRRPAASGAAGGA